MTNLVDIVFTVIWKIVILQKNQVRFRERTRKWKAICNDISYIPDIFEGDRSSGVEMECKAKHTRGEGVKEVDMKGTDAYSQ